MKPLKVSIEMSGNSEERAGAAWPLAGISSPWPGAYGSIGGRQDIIFLQLGLEIPHLNL